MNRRFAFQDAPRCTARSKRSGEPCRNPAVRGWTVCRFHGAGGGAPRGPAHGAFNTGRHTIEAKTMRAIVREAWMAINSVAPRKC